MKTTLLVLLTVSGSLWLFLGLVFCLAIYVFYRQIKLAEKYNRQVTALQEEIRHMTLPELLEKRKGIRELLERKAEIGVYDPFLDEALEMVTQKMLTYLDYNT